jgi:hypothetical protein
MSDPAGYSAIKSAQLLISNGLAMPNSCYISFNGAANAISLATDAGTALQEPVTLGQSGTLQNSQCSINPAASSVSGSGANATLNIALTFQSSFAGSKNVYMEVNDGVGDSGWVQVGTWTVPAAGNPQAVSVAPSSGTGNTQVFTFVVSDPAGYTAINSAQVLIGNSLATANTCYIFYSRATNLLYLANDAGNAWPAPVTVGQSGTLQNSQCSIDALSSSASGSGTNLTLNLNLTFSGSFAGSRNVYMEAYDGVGDSGWFQRGTWTVPAGTPQAVSVAPSSGSGSAQVFTFTYSDPRGYTAIGSTQTLIGSSLFASGSCYLFFNRYLNTVYLFNDAGTAWSSPVTLGQAGTLQNGQCALNPILFT